MRKFTEVLCLNLKRAGNNVRPMRVLRLRRSLLSFLPSIVVTVLAALVVAGLEVLATQSELAPEILTRSSWMVRVLAVVPGAMLLSLLWRYFNEIYVFKPHVICHHQGMLSLAYSMPVIDYRDIREVVISQGLLGRLMDYGDIFIGTAATNDLEMRLRDVPDPYGIEKFIQRRRARRDQRTSLQGQFAEIAERKAAQVLSFGTRAHASEGVSG